MASAGDEQKPVWLGLNLSRAMLRCGARGPKWPGAAVTATDPGLVVALATVTENRASEAASCELLGLCASEGSLFSRMAKLTRMSPSR